MSTQNWVDEHEVAGSQSQRQSQSQPPQHRTQVDDKHARPTRSDEFNPDRAERKSLDQEAGPGPRLREKAVHKGRDGMTPEVSPENEGFRSSEDH